MKRPLLTVVSVILNPGAVIKQTFQSIESLKTDELEYIVLDGGSTDDTPELIRQYSHIIDYHHSRSDKGIYDAMNIATQLAKGEYILNINAGDELLTVPFEQLYEASSQNIKILCCGVVTEQGKKLFPRWSNLLKHYNTLPHQGCFYHRSLFEMFQYDIRLRVFADFDLNQRLYRHRIKAVTNTMIVARHDMRGLSNNPIHTKELFSIVRKNFGLCSLFLSWLHFKKEGLLFRFSSHKNTAQCISSS